MSEQPFRRALVIRGGALGDFLLTLPVLASLREAAPDGRVEILAYPALAGLARSCGLADEARSIEYGGLAGFFARGSVLEPGLRDYFGRFDLVISYLYDPDGIFAENVSACGAARFIQGLHRPRETSHAIDQLAEPLAGLGLPLSGRAVRLQLQPATTDSRVIALHPGSGSPAKNWPAENWRAVAGELLAAHPHARLAIIGGEADAAAVDTLRGAGGPGRSEHWDSLPLPDLAAHLAGAALYLGHDTGVSHLAAAAGAPCLLLFGPSDPGVWAPPHEGVRILRAPEANLDLLPVPAVLQAARSLGGRRLAGAARPADDARP